MLRICLGIAVIIAGFIYPFHIEVYFIIGALLITSGIFDGDFKTLMKKEKKRTITKPSKRKNRKENIDWKKRFESNPNSQKLIFKFAKKIVEKDVVDTTIREDGISFGKRTLKFQDIDMKNLDESGCKVMSEEITKILRKNYNIASTITRKKKGSQNTRNPKLLNLLSLSEKNQFDGYEIHKEEKLYENKMEGLKDW